MGVNVAEEVADGAAGFCAHVATWHRAEAELSVQIDAQLMQIDYGLGEAEATTVRLERRPWRI